MSTTQRSHKVKKSSAKKILKSLKLQCPERICKLDLHIGFLFGKSVLFNMSYTLFQTFKL